MDPPISWPPHHQLIRLRELVSSMSGTSPVDVRIVVSPYRICPLGAHIDHQGGTVSAMTIDKGILLGFIPSGDSQVILRSSQFEGEARFSVDEVQHPIETSKKDENHATDDPKLKEVPEWGKFARGALYALQRTGNSITQGIIGYVSGSEGFDRSGLSSSAAVGVAYLLALESANNLNVPPALNIEYDRLIENEYFGLRNGILDQSATLLSSHGCLTCIDCKTKEYKLIRPSKLLKPYKILIAFSGLRHALTSNPGYNHRVEECRDAARFLLKASGNDNVEPVLCNVEPETYKLYKCKLETVLAKRAEHFFSENTRVIKGLEAWASGNVEEFGRLISASGLSSIENYECGCEPMIDLYEILGRAPGIYGARFSGAGFRGCCVGFVDAEYAREAADFVREEYGKAQPKLASEMKPESMVMICEAGDCAHVIC